MGGKGWHEKPHLSNINYRRKRRDGMETPFVIYKSPGQDGWHRKPNFSTINHRGKGDGMENPLSTVNLRAVLGQEGGGPENPICQI